MFDFDGVIADDEAEEEKRNSDYKRILRTAIVTARNAPSHERVITTLESWGVWADETFFLGGMEKSRILNVLKPHMFFDDQLSHLKPSNDNIPMVHIHLVWQIKQHLIINVFAISSCIVHFLCIH